MPCCLTRQTILYLTAQIHLYQENMQQSRSGFHQLVRQHLLGSVKEDLPYETTTTALFDYIKMLA